MAVVETSPSAEHGSSDEAISDPGPLSGNQEEDRMSDEVM